MNRQFVNLARNPTRNIPGIAGTDIPATFCDVTRVEFPDYVALYVSGKLGTDEDGKLVGRTMREQAERAYENVRQVLETQGATLADVVRTLVLVTQIDPDSLREIHEIRARIFPKGKYPASTLARVSQLVREGGLIEVEAEAIVMKTAARQ